MLSSASLFATLFSLTLVVAVASDTARSQEANGANEAKLWALLVCGSDGYNNYRHQADICHAYQVLHNHGIPDEHIVVMMKDDIANNSLNPTPGVIINYPNGPDVYRGVPKDYTGDLVTPSNFLDVLQGKKVKGGSGKVISSGPNDHIFINFVDHGAPGLLMFPDEVLHARQLVSAIIEMHEQKKFDKMVLYVEACKSGSIFDGLLPANVSIYATTAANPFENSQACYLDMGRHTYLGDCYSLLWMGDSERADLRKRTVVDQFEFVRNVTSTSHIMQYGDFSVARLLLSQFQGNKRHKPIVHAAALSDPVYSYDVPVVILEKKLAKASDNATKDSLKRELERTVRNRSFLKSTITEIAKLASGGSAEHTTAILGSQLPLRNFDCYEKAVQCFSYRCFKLSKNTYALEYLYVLVNMCELGYDVSNITQALEIVCTYPTFHGIV
ncbi:legumain-like [Dermacentor silvarum]|uniref:legumain-like n=1 Tax=Dermacentor silvarum TaxID=543639 RepID=UPI001897C5A4|nr:legumain-like [Dermacentor silvarum]